jgi:hypothetical protein
MAKPPASPVFNQTCTASGKPPRVTLTGAWYKTWLANGVLRKETYRDQSQRKDRTGLFVNDTKRPGARNG